MNLKKMLGLDLERDVPVFAVISRLVGHKGMELFEIVYERMMCLDIQLVVIGTGEKKYEDFFRFLENSYKGRISANIMFNSERASKIYAGADFLIMPSKSEPCGLSQLIAMRYGTIPIVRETGGLVDTVTPIDLSTLDGNGFTFKTYDAEDMLGSVIRAAEFYRQKEKFEYVRKKIMMIDNSWKKSAKEYMKLYSDLLGSE